MITKEFEGTNGITLIALIISILVLLILAGVTLQLAVGEDGIIGRAIVAREQHEAALEREKLELAVATALTKGKGIISMEKLNRALKEQFGNEAEVQTNCGGWVYKKKKSYIVFLDGKIEEKVNGKLPTAFQEVEYIESTGTQYIDTRYYPNNLTDVECKFMYNQFTGNTLSSVFGVRDADNTVKQFLMSVANNTLWIVNGLNNTNISSIRPLVNTEYILRITPQKAYWNGTKILNMSFSVANCPDYSMFMFGRNTRSGFANALLGKVYYLKIYEAGVLLRNFLPCYCTETVTDINGKNCPNGTIGLYDLVEDQFYTNQGTGEFLKGEDV